MFFVDGKEGLHNSFLVLCVVINYIVHLLIFEPFVTPLVGNLIPLFPRKAICSFDLSISRKKI